MGVDNIFFHADRLMFGICFKDLIDERGVAPLYTLHERLGGWPMIKSTWDASGFDLIQILTDLRLLNNGYLLNMWVSADDRNSSVNIVQVLVKLTRVTMIILRNFKQPSMRKRK